MLVCHGPIVYSFQRKQLLTEAVPSCRCPYTMPPKRPPFSSGAASLTTLGASPSSYWVLQAQWYRRFCSAFPVPSGRLYSGARDQHFVLEFVRYNLGDSQSLFERRLEWKPRCHKEYDRGAHGRDQRRAGVFAFTDGSGGWLHHRVRHTCLSSPLRCSLMTLRIN